METGREEGPAADAGERPPAADADERRTSLGAEHTLVSGELLRQARAVRAANQVLASRVGEALSTAGRARQEAQEARQRVRAQARAVRLARRLRDIASGERFASDDLDRSAVVALHGRYAARREPAVRDRLVEAHQALAVGLAARFSDRGETMEDLRQVALMALVKAVESFDPQRRVQFSSYATVTILGELKRHFRDKRWGLRVPRTLQEEYLRTRDAVQELTQSLGRSPTIADIAAHLATTEDKVLEAMEVGRALRVGSLDAPLDPDDPGSSAQVGGLDAGLGTVEDRGTLGPAMARLPHREQLILRLRFVEGQSQAEIGRRIGLSQMQVSRLLAASLDRLRGWLEEPSSSGRS